MTAAIQRRWTAKPRPKNKKTSKSASKINIGIDPSMGQTCEEQAPPSGPNKLSSPFPVGSEPKPFDGSARPGAIPLGPPRRVSFIAVGYGKRGNGTGAPDPA